MDAAPDTEAPRASCYEDLAAELQLSISEYSMWQNLESTSGNAVPAFSAVNGRLAELHREAQSASTVMHALAIAKDGRAFAAALRRLGEAPPRHAHLCCEAAWRAFLRRATASDRSLPLGEAALSQVLDSAAGRADLQPPLWQRAIVWLSKREVGVPSPGMAMRLLTSLAASPSPVPPDLWRRMVQLVGCSVACRGVMSCFLTVPGLGAAQRADLAILLDCVNPYLRNNDGPTMLALLQRVETDMSECCRLPALDLLNRYWPMLATADYELARKALREVLMRLPDADREAALRLLPLEPVAEDRQRRILKAVQELPADAGARILMYYAGDFAWNPSSKVDLQTACADLARRAWPDPALHHRVLLTFARTGANHCHGAMGIAMARLALAECPRQDPGGPVEPGECPRHTAPERLAVLALLPPQALPPNRWGIEWMQALADLDRMEDAGSSQQALRTVKALLGGLSLRHTQAQAFPRVLRALDALPPDARARALAQVLLACAALPGKFRDRDFDSLRARCANLPFYLRSQSLALLDGLAATSSLGAWMSVCALRRETADLQQAHDVYPALGLPAAGTAAGATA